MKLEIDNNTEPRGLQSSELVHLFTDKIALFNH